jgi:CubicO group peptidase (beta-lactamase class C family)
MTLPSRTSAVCLTAVLLAGSLLLAADKAKPKPPDPANVRARTLALYTPTFSSYVFQGTTFPALTPPRFPEDVEKAVGPFKAQTTFYDSAFKPVKEAATPGIYGAVVDLKPRTGPIQRRFIILYRTPARVPEATTYGPRGSSDFARALGIKREVVQRQWDETRKRIKDRPFKTLARDLQFARWVAGLSLSAAGKTPVHRYDDAEAHERQWWVTLKRRLYGWDKLFPRAFVCPKPKEGKPAPVVRAGTPAEAGVKKDTAKKIDAALQAFAKDTDQAFAVCIVRRGVIVLHKAYGKRDGKPMTVDTKSWMASVTKTIAATTMLMLIDQGLVKFDDRIEKFLPPLKGIKVKKPLTIHHLYTHTNGLTLDGWPGWHDAMPDVAERLSAYYDRLRVGTEWAYTGTGNIVGGKIIEAVTGEAVPQFYHKHLLAPLGCTGTDVTDTHAGAFSIPLDMARFGQLLLNRGSYGKHQFFRHETFARMLPGDLTKLLGKGAKRTFGFGLDGNAKKFGHGAASAATFHVDTERELVVIMTRNKYGKNQDKYNGLFWKAIDEGIVK